MSTVLYVTLHPENEGMEAAGQLRGCEDAAEERKESRWPRRSREETSGKKNRKETKQTKSSKRCPEKHERVK